MSERMTPTVIKIDVAAGNTQYSKDLTGAKSFSFQCRTAVDVRFAFASGKVATPTDPYMTLKSGSAYNSPDKLDTADSVTLYVAAASAVVVELLVWY